MTYAREEWKRERLSWRAVIQLNLIRSIVTILDLVQGALDNIASAPPSIANNVTSLQVLLLRLKPLRTVKKDLMQALGRGARETDGPIIQEFQVSVRKWCDLISSTAKGTLETKQKKDLESPVGIIASCLNDMKALWGDAGVQDILRREEVDLHTAGGLSVFFLIFLSIGTAE
jgi:guanine nucleotide-binding protein alpha-1 subunit